MNSNALKFILEALLLSSRDPLSIQQLRSAFTEHEKPEVNAIKQAIHQLEQDYQERAIELKKSASGYSFQTRLQFAPWINRLAIEKPIKYSRAFLETLAIIAYKQPVTRADIESIRGVGLSSSILKTLLERQWVCIQEYKNAPGKPALYGTTSEFLDYFNLTALEQLPPLSQLLTTMEYNID